MKEKAKTVVILIMGMGSICRVKNVMNKMSSSQLQQDNENLANTILKHFDRLIVRLISIDLYQIGIDRFHKNLKHILLYISIKDIGSLSGS